MHTPVYALYIYYKNIYNMASPENNEYKIISNPNPIVFICLILFGKFGDPGWIRTTNLPLRRGLLYPVEPQSHFYILMKLIHLEKMKTLLCTKYWRKILR